MKNRRELKKAARLNAVQNVGKPVTEQVGKQKQEAEGSDIYASGGNKWVLPAITTTLIEQYADNALLAEPLKNIKDLVFTSYEDHPTPWVTIKDPEGNIDDDLSKQGQQIAKACDFYNAHITAFMDEEKGGCSVWSPGWGNLDGVTGICPVELRNLPWNSFRDLPYGFTDVYNDIMPGVVIDKITGKVRIFQTKDDQHRPEEIVQTAPLPTWLIVRDPTSPKPAGKPGCLPVIALITKYNHSDHAMDQKMNRIGAPIAIPLADITKANKDLWEGFTKKWGKDTVFVLPKGTEFADLKLSENTTAEDRLATLKKLIDGFYNPATFVQKEGNTIGGSDSGAASMVNKRTVSTLSQLESGLGEALLQVWLDINGFVGYTPEVRYPRPETQDDVQTLAEIAEANKNGHISRMEARQKYPNLDLPDLTPEEEAKMDAEYEKRKPQQLPFGQVAGQTGPNAWDLTNVKSEVGNVQMPVSQTEAELVAAHRQLKKDVMRIVKEKANSQYPQSPTEGSLFQRVKNIFMPVNNADEEGTWVTINGAHILIKDGETASDAFKRATGKDLGSKGSGKPARLRTMDKNESITKNAVYRATAKDSSHYAEYDLEGNRVSQGEGSSFVTPSEDELVVWDSQAKSHAIQRKALQTKNKKLSTYSTPITESSSEIKQIIENREYDHYGLRVLTESPRSGKSADLNIGDIVPNSYEWNDGIPTGRMLEGTSVIKIDPKNIDRSINQLKPYLGEKVVLVGSSSGSYGEDEGEFVMSGAKVISTYKKGIVKGE